MKISVGVSNRHVHLTRDTYEYLFEGKELEKRNDLNQVGEFASTDTVDIVYNGKTIPHVRVLGPFRKYNQIELLGSDLKELGLVAPVRRSGDLDDTPSVIIKNNDRSVESDGVIRAERHVHVPTSKKKELGLEERDEVILKTPSSSFTAFVKISDNGYLEVHIDKDEALEYGIENHQEVEILNVENR